MAPAGDWFQNVKTKELAQLKVSPEETGGRRLEAEVWLQPGAAVMAEHVHDHLRERFTVLDGELSVIVDGELSVAGPRAVVDVPSGRAHDWSNRGATVAHVQVEVEGEPPMALRFVEMIEVVFGLANTGHTDDAGKPTPLWLAAVATEYRDVMRLTSPPAVVQRVVLGPLAAVARRRGCDPRARWLHGPGGPAHVPAPSAPPSQVAT